MQNFPPKPMSPSSSMPDPAWIIRRRPGSKAHRGLLITPFGTFDCRLGRTGITTRKREGDGATPAGRVRVLGGYRRADRLRYAAGSASLAIAGDKLGWCDEPSSANYNRPVRLPFRGSHEKMLREDRLYDACLVLDWNFLKRSRNRGSAIFLHLTREDGGPTAGCIAIDPKLFARLLAKLVRQQTLRILP